MSEPSEIGRPEGQGALPQSKGKGFAVRKLWNDLTKAVVSIVISVAATVSLILLVYDRGRDDERRHQEQRQEMMRMAQRQEQERLAREQERLEKLSLDLREQVQFINDYFLLPEFYERCTQGKGVPDRNQKACNMPNGQSYRFSGTKFQDLIWESRPDSAGSP